MALANLALLLLSATTAASGAATAAPGTALDLSPDAKPGSCRCSGSDYQTEYDEGGHDIGSYCVVASPQECCVQCAKTAGCVYYVLNTRQNKCYLQSSLQGKHKKADNIAGASVSPLFAKSQGYCNTPAYKEKMAAEEVEEISGGVLLALLLAYCAAGAGYGHSRGRSWARDGVALWPGGALLKRLCPCLPGSAGSYEPIGGGDGGGYGEYTVEDGRSEVTDLGGADGGGGGGGGISKKQRRKESRRQQRAEAQQREARQREQQAQAAEQEKGLWAGFVRVITARGGNDDDTIDKLYAAVADGEAGAARPHAAGYSGGGGGGGGGGAGGGGGGRQKQKRAEEESVFVPRESVGKSSTPLVAERTDENDTDYSVGEPVEYWSKSKSAYIDAVSLLCWSCLHARVRPSPGACKCLANARHVCRAALVEPAPSTVCHMPLRTTATAQARTLR